MYPLFLILLLAASPVMAEETCSPLLDFTVPTLLEHKPVHLCEAYQGKVVLIVNTASKCAFTPQYDGLEKLYAKYKAQGLVILGFPSNDFGGQEPGSEKQVQAFCRLTYDVKFPMFRKSSVKQGIASPLYHALAEASGTYPQWNFHKYLLDRQGKMASSFASKIRPEDKELTQSIEHLLGKQP